MNLGKHIVNKLLAEASAKMSGKIKHIVAVYPGRFQPAGTHHFKTYKWITSQFDDAWVATSDKVELPKSPLTFSDKKKIWNKHGVTKIVKVKNPYIATELLSKYNSETTAVVFIVGSKDQERLSSKFFKKWDGVASLGYKEAGYTMIAPHISLNISGYGEMSGTTIRKALSQNPNTPESKKMFKDIMGWYDPSLHKLIANKLYIKESIYRFTSGKTITDIINESSNTSSAVVGDVDDGPGGWYDIQSHYKDSTSKIANKLGMHILNYLSGDKEFLTSDDYNQNVTSPSSFPSGVEGKETPTNQQNLKTKAAYQVWKKHILQLSTKIGMQFIDFLGAEYSTRIDEPNKILSRVDTLHEKIHLNEGGAYGHMSHPFDDKNLTFQDLKNIINLSLQGNLDMESTVTEKTDGQNLFITWANDKLMAARNSGDLKSGGMDSKAIASKFSGRGNIEKAFTYAMADLASAIKSLSSAQKSKIFDNGKNWVNMEIIYPASKNVISYDAPYIQFHNVLQYNSSIPVGEVKDGARILSGMIAQINKNMQKNFNIIGPKPLMLKKHLDFSAKKSYFYKKLDSIRNQYKLSNTATLTEYHQAWWDNFISKQFPTLDNNSKISLIKRWAFFDKGTRLNSSITQDSALLAKIIEFDKKDHLLQVKKNMFPLETLFFELGAEVLKNIEEFLAVNPDKAVQSIRSQIAKSIRDVRAGGDLKKLNTLDAQLAKINAIGGFKSIVPSEGLVFIYGGKTFKLTGAFAPINQITGLMNFD
jgi:hypothetical protein